MKHSVLDITENKFKNRCMTIHRVINTNYVYDYIIS
jgi:hypothetical protein